LKRSAIGAITMSWSKERSSQYSVRMRKNPSPRHLPVAGRVVGEIGFARHLDVPHDAVEDLRDLGSPLSSTGCTLICGRFIRCSFVTWRMCVGSGLIVRQGRAPPSWSRRCAA
jgi:hypothetical protein